MTSIMRCKILSFEDVYNMVKRVAEKVKASEYEPTTIVGLARGGWVPARLMCDFLGITDLVSLKVEHWLETGKTKDEATIKYPIASSMSGKRLLVVDDITDTGKSILTSLEHLRKLDPEDIRVGVMQYIKTSKCKPDYYAEEVTDWYWFIYPWNWIEDTSTLIVRLLSEDEESRWTLDSINSGLQEFFEIKWDRDELRYILNVMCERGQVEALEDYGGSRYVLRRRRVIQL